MVRNDMARTKGLARCLTIHGKPLNIIFQDGLWPKIN